MSKVYCGMGMHAQKKNWCFLFGNPFSYCQIVECNFPSKFLTVLYVRKYGMVLRAAFKANLKCSSGRPCTASAQIAGESGGEDRITVWLNELKLYLQHNN